MYINRAEEGVINMQGTTNRGPFRGQMLGVLSLFPASKAHLTVAVTAATNEEEQKDAHLWGGGGKERRNGEEGRSGEEGRRGGMGRREEAYK